ncbi:MAG TPA: type IV secretion system DNA-binding domain-containing protein [Candidatus Bathyarchaeia archaeon]|nr:type IV secretion system DNA-binding domain-containing protein [Candidatus Bathyarchaeia archaeon]
MDAYNLNLILYPLAGLAAVVCFASGILLVFKSFVSFRGLVTRSLNMDLDVVKVSRPMKREAQGGEQQQPKSEKELISVMEHLFASLGNIKEKASIWHRIIYGDAVVALEIANPADNDEICFYVGAPKKFINIVERQIHSFYPKASIERVKDYNIFSPGSFTAASSLTLKDQHHFPIRTYQTLEADPLNNITNVLGKFDEKKEGAAIQLLMKPARGGWRYKGKQVAHKMQQGRQLSDVKRDTLVRQAGRGFLSVLRQKDSKQKDILDQNKETIQLTPEEQEVVKKIEGKAGKAGFNLNIRLVASALHQPRAEEILSELENAFIQYENPGLNSFKVLRENRLRPKNIAFDFIFRNFREDQSFILSSEEMASVFHFPLFSTETPKIAWLKARTAAPPSNISTEGIILGFNDYRGVETVIRHSEDDRRRHFYVVGQTGTGKSTMMEEMVKQDIKNGKGVCVVDPHGDLVDHILESIPKERAEDVIYFDPADMERPYGLNMLEFDQTKPEQKTFVINEMINIFDKLYDLKQTGGPMFEQYMRNAALLVMEHPDSGSTLMEIPRVLADEEFRHLKLSHCTNPVVKNFWEKEAEKAGGEAALANMVPYITSKLTQFISNDMMRPIIAQEKSTIDFRQAMDTQQIILVNLSKGKIGEINANLLGMIIVGKILISALSRVDMPESERKDFYLYIDEFQNFTTDSIAQILSEARKYRLALVIAHQFIAQLKEEISKAVFGNVGSICAFRVGAEDAEYLQKQFEPVFDANDLMNVDNRNCFMKLLIASQVAPPFNMKTYPPTPGSKEIAEAVKELSKLKYGRNHDIVNEEIMKKSSFVSAPATADAFDMGEKPL